MCVCACVRACMCVTLVLEQVGSYSPYPVKYMYPAIQYVHGILAFPGAIVCAHCIPIVFHSAADYFLISLLFYRPNNLIPSNDSQVSLPSAGYVWPLAYL